MNLYRISESRRILVASESLRGALLVYLNGFDPDEAVVSGLIAERLEPEDRVGVVGEDGAVRHTTAAELVAGVDPAGGPRTFSEYRAEAPAGPDVGRPGVAQP